MFWWFAQNAVIGALLAGVVWPVCRIRRLSPAVRHALWLVVLLKLVTPPLVTWPWPVPSFFESLQAASVRRKPDSVSPDELADAENARAIHLEEADAMVLIRAGLIDDSYLPSDPPQTDDAHSAGISVATTSGKEPMTTFEAALRADTAAPERLPRSGDHRISAAATGLAQIAGRGSLLVALGWMLGTAVSILVHLIQVARFLRLVARAERTPESLVRRVKSVAAALRVRPPQVSLVPEIRSPVIWGGVRAQLIWPACLPANFESGRWDGVIAHELAHLRRHDHWVGWLELLAGCVCWWNPLFWYVRHQLRENAELACDALVVWALPDGRRIYAESLIEVVSHFSQVATRCPSWV